MAKSGSVESASVLRTPALVKRKLEKRSLVYRSTAIFPSELTKVRSSGPDIFCFCICPLRFFKLAASAAASLIIDFICLPNFAYRDISRRYLYDVVLLTIFVLIND